jgi:hypothetical protein
MEDKNKVLATILDPFYKMAFFDVWDHPRCKDMLIQTVETSIKSDQFLPNNIPEYEDDDPIERYLNSKEGESEGAGPNQLQICSPPILDEKLRAIHVSINLIIFFASRICSIFRRWKNIFELRGISLSPLLQPIGMIQLMQPNFLTLRLDFVYFLSYCQHNLLGTGPKISLGTINVF